MLAQRTHARAVVLAFLTLCIAALSAGPAAAKPRTPDGVPAGVAIPDVAGDNQAYEFGDCQSRTHSSGGWVCSPSPAELRVATARASARTARSSKKHRKRAMAHAAGYARYNFNLDGVLLQGLLRCRRRSRI